MFFFINHTSFRVIVLAIYQTVKDIEDDLYLNCPRQLELQCCERKWW